ncbi:hypothetical protein [Tellurirhabdus bombi]|uniref:hypothetical protein n=1 Tax=Tellurirhabdus bombi TaxID=2907205 RepID=UPI001F2B0C7D|nr:hypothetical protein [Tellurirhabdus bombi]
MHFLLTLWFTSLLAGPTPLKDKPRTVQADYEKLVAAERNFAQSALDLGLREAFVANLDENSVVFQNQFLPGKATYQKQPASSGKLTWRPNYAEIAASGTLGYTTGPFEFRAKSSDEAPVAYGQYTSVWHKTPSGEWKALIDFGCTHAKPTGLISELKSPTQFAVKSLAALDTSVINKELMQTEMMFAQIARTQNLRDAYARVLPASDSVRLLREGSVVYEGAAARKLVEAAAHQVEYQPIQAITAPSGDFGYTYGYAMFKQNRQGYLRIWRKRAGSWQLAHEVLSVKLSS